MSFVDVIKNVGKIQMSITLVIHDFDLIFSFLEG